jgi:plastocyanin
VAKPGYQDYQSGILAIEGEWLNLEVQLSPVVEGQADFTVHINRNGFNPSVLNAPAGSVVEFVNADVKEHSSTSEGLTVNASAGDWDSGALPPGASFRIVVGEEGTYDYYDRANPLNAGTIIAGPNVFQVFLPLVLR